MNVFILFVISFLSLGVALAANPYQPGGLELAVAGLSVCGLFSWHMVKYHRGHTSSSAEHLLNTIESNFTSSWALRPTTTITQVPATTTIRSYVTRYPSEYRSNKINWDTTSTVLTERTLIAIETVNDLIHNGITFIRTYLVQPACLEIMRIYEQSPKGPLLELSLYLINLLLALEWSLGKAILRAVIFVDYCIIIFGSIKIYGYLSLACKNVTGLTLFGVLKLIIIIIIPQSAGRMSVATQTEGDASPPTTPPTTPASASSASGAPPKSTTEDADDDDDVLPPANTPATSNVVVLRPIVRVPTEGSSIFVDRRRAMHPQGPFGGRTTVVGESGVPIILTEEEEEFAPPGFGEDE
ncbi:hypothetical protein H2202_009474 [Exophiala xenobiotica]|nr:hypothetical protein H2202_009474 [Exophiala xenobiotica]KAK5204834.1 hypothetical protein LTR41_009370 [Exophiala xenobiotica]KAK5260113.1 hypothetical protein LTR40_004734 [Exophiala xenobiotica]KAK5286526.1 hypothetical protein LTR14_009897 [Exophiala xenobiotica]KAK5478328.1 hypothetical protein LTR26_007837 [Exophiala xenobiotica]